MKKVETIPIKPNEKDIIRKNLISVNKKIRTKPEKVLNSK
jgi:hypothetical protein